MQHLRCAVVFAISGGKGMSREAKKGGIRGREGGWDRKGTQIWAPAMGKGHMLRKRKRWRWLGYSEGENNDVLRYWLGQNMLCVTVVCRVR